MGPLSVKKRANIFIKKFGKKKIPTEFLQILISFEA